MIKVGFLVAGFKGYVFFKSIHSDLNVSFVSSYDVKGTLDDSYNQIKSQCIESGYKFVERDNLKDSIFDKANIIFLVGWQYILNDIDERFIIFHDSLLPKYRGFSPTVNALIAGEKTIGITALKPTALADRGPIYEQKSINIKYPFKIKDAFLLVSNCYVQVAKTIIDKKEKGSLTYFAQNESLATYSIWRDESDYFIDWNWSSDKIARFVDAVGWPFLGAKTLYQNKEIFIDEVVVIDDLIFENRQAGKIWSLSNGKLEVICGKGMIKVISARSIDGSKIVFNRLRERLGGL